MKILSASNTLKQLSITNNTFEMSTSTIKMHILIWVSATLSWKDLIKVSRLQKKHWKLTKAMRNVIIDWLSSIKKLQGRNTRSLLMQLTFRGSLALSNTQKNRKWKKFVIIIDTFTAKIREKGNTQKMKIVLSKNVLFSCLNRKVMFQLIKHLMNGWSSGIRIYKAKRQSGLS